MYRLLSSARRVSSVLRKEVFNEHREQEPEGRHQADRQVQRQGPHGGGREDGRRLALPPKGREGIQEPIFSRQRKKARPTSRSRSWTTSPMRQKARCGIGAARAWTASPLRPASSRWPAP